MAVWEPKPVPLMIEPELTSAAGALYVRAYPYDADVWAKTFECPATIRRYLSPEMMDPKNQMFILTADRRKKAWVPYIREYKTPPRMLPNMVEHMLASTQGTISRPDPIGDPGLFKVDIKPFGEDFVVQ